MRGRKPKPSALKALAGNPGKRRINRKEPKPAEALVEYPADLPEGARPFWRDALADAPPGLLTRLDGATLKVWAVAAWLHSTAARQISDIGLMVRGPTKGTLMQSPYVAILNRQAQIMLRAAAEMGFTPSSRSRVSTVDAAPLNPMAPDAAAAPTESVGLDGFNAQHPEAIGKLH